DAGLNNLGRNNDARLTASSAQIPLPTLQRPKAGVHQVWRGTVLSQSVIKQDSSFHRIEYHEREAFSRVILADCRGEALDIIGVIGRTLASMRLAWLRLLKFGGASFDRLRYSK